MALGDKPHIVPRERVPHELLIICDSAELSRKRSVRPGSGFIACLARAEQLPGADQIDCRNSSSLTVRAALPEDVSKTCGKGCV